MHSRFFQRPDSIRLNLIRTQRDTFPASQRRTYAARVAITEPRSFGGGELAIQHGAHATQYARSDFKLQAQTFVSLNVFLPDEPPETFCGFHRMDHWIGGHVNGRFYGFDGMPNWVGSDADNACVSERDG